MSRALAAAALVALACGTMLAASGRAFAPSTMPDTDAPPERIGSLELLGAVELPAGATLESEPIGGLSGLLWDPAAGCFLALSDDASEKAPARFYEVEIGLGEDGKLEAADVRFLRRVRLTDPRGEPFAPAGIDPEGFARLPDGDLVIGSEGVRSSGARPFLARFGRDGRERSRFELDERYLPDGAGGRGPRPNFGFESLAVTADGATLVAGLENALVQDGPMSDVATPSPARLLLRDLSGRGHDRELVYEVDAVRGVPPDTAAFRANGLVDLVALGPSRLLALEREFVAGAGSVVRLYEVELEGATDVTEHASLAAATGVVPVVKRLLLDFAELDVPLDNYEAMAFGPRLADGRRLLVVLSDDNFRPEEQRTRLIAFATSSEPRSIGALQGAFHHSPLRDRWVAGVEGVVTAVDPRARPPAFFLQATVPDGDPATSDGIRVAVEGLPLPAPGDRVGVRGRVEERAATPKQLPVTTLRLSALEALGSGVPLPAAVRVGIERQMPRALDADALAEFRPDRDALDFWESLEAMRVELPAGSVSGPTLGYDELVLALDDGGLPRTAAGGLRLTRRGPPLARATVGGRLAGGLLQLAVGARFAGPITGVVDYSFSNFKLLATPPLPPASGGAVCDGRPTRLVATPGTLTVATSNLENLSAADDVARFALAGRVIARELAAPAVVALEEVQDDSGREKGDGVVTAERTLARLVDAIVAAGGPRYESVSIDPEPDREGGVPGGNIRVALLYDPARVGFERRGAAGAFDATEPEGRGAAMRLTLNPGRVAPDSAAFTPPSGEGVRRSLAVELRVGGRPLFVVANHWSSKFDDDRAFGAVQPPAEPTAAKRRAQAEVVRGFVERLLVADPRARVVVLGDLNDFPWSDAVKEISRRPLVNLMLELSETERYTYNFEGFSQALDYVVVSPALERGAEIEPLHRNTDCPESLRSSDHDPIVARLRIDG